MPKLFPTLLGATTLCVLVSQPNLAQAQIVISNGTTVGQQTLGPSQSILVEQGGNILEVDDSAIEASGNFVAVENSGSLDLEIQNAAPAGTQRGAIQLAGDNGTIHSSGTINLTVRNSLPGVSPTFFELPTQDIAAINLAGNQNSTTVSGNVTVLLEGSPNPIPACQSGTCTGTVLGDITTAVHGISIDGNNNTLNITGSVSAQIERATHAQSSAIFLNGIGNFAQNSGEITIHNTTSSRHSLPDFIADPAGREWALSLGASNPLSTVANVYANAGVLLKGTNNVFVNNALVRATQDANMGTGLAAISSYWDTQDGNQIINNGVVESDRAAVSIRNGTVLNNGLISGNGGLFRGVTGNLGVHLYNSNLVNNGTIISVGGAAVAVEKIPATFFGEFPDYALGNTHILNSGLLEGLLSGVFLQNADVAMVDNRGSIRGIRAIQIGGGGAPSLNNVIINNTGDITGSTNGIESIISTSVDINNSGTISGTQNAVDFRLSAEVNIENSGSIFGETAINLLEGNLILDNSGRIFTTGIADQDYAIRLTPPDPSFDPFTFAAPQDDEITFRPGTRIIGRMLLGADSFFFPPSASANGNDTITLDRTSPDIAWRWTFDHFDIPGQDPIDQTGFSDSLFILGNNVPYYIWNGPVTGDYGPFPSEGGITVYIPNISGIFAANGIMEDIARTVHGGIRNRLNEGWDHENMPQDLFYRSEDDIVLRDGSDLIGAPLEALDPAVFRKAPPLTVWAKGFGGMRNEAGTANYGDYSHLWTGGMAGLDLRGTQGDENDDGLRDTEDDNHWNIGILGGYVESDLSFASGFKDIQSDFFFAGAYGRLVRDALYLDASVIGGFGGMSEYGPIANNLVPGGIENPGEGYSTDGRFISPSASIGKRFYITDTISFTPEVNATYLAQWIDGSTSPLTLSIEDRFIDTVFGHVQGSVKKIIKRDNSTIIGELRGGLYMSRQLHGDETNLSVVSNQFTIDTSRDDIVSPYVGLGATWEIANNFKLSADGEMDFGDLDGGRVRFGASLGF